MSEKIVLELSTEQYQEWTKMMKETDLKSNKEFINLAVSLTHWLINQKKSGRSIFSIHSSGEKILELKNPQLNKVQVKTKDSRQIDSDSWPEHLDDK
ncbi:TPA: hypothetical protein DCG61_00655 [Patescibacteria group bacterium]|jgi:ribonuclease HIII|nr:hypothetical protein [Patescibacteria group bacterium]